MTTKEWKATDGLGNHPHPKMALDEERAINEAFIAWAVTIGRSKEDDNLEVSIPLH